MTLLDLELVMGLLCKVRYVRSVTLFGYDHSARSTHRLSLRLPRLFPRFTSTLSRKDLVLPWSVIFQLVKL